MRYLRNVWYFAALEEDFAQTDRLARTILDEPVLLFKNDAGVVSAIGDRCPHRFAPLHLGKVLGSHVECPYHGLRFDSSGACVHNPHGDGKIAANAKVKAYPLVARDSILWIWMGDAEQADPARIPDYSFIGRAAPISRQSSTMLVNCNYQLLTDNILDLTHADFVHHQVLGTGALTQKATPRVWEDGEAINIEWSVERDLIAPGLNFGMPDPHAPMDSWISVRWDAPSCMLLETGVTLTGRPREEGIKALALHVMTPATEWQTHYLNLGTRNFLLTEDFNVQLKEILRVAFVEQDKPMVEAQQRMMGTTDLWSLKPVLLPGDVGAVRVRRALERMMKAQAAPA